MRFGFLARVGAVFVLLVALGAASGARAAPVLYDFSFTETSVAFGGSGSFSGQFTVENGLVTAVTGTSTLWGAIKGLIAPSGYQGNDNAFSPVVAVAQRQWRVVHDRHSASEFVQIGGQRMGGEHRPAYF